LAKEFLIYNLKGNKYGIWVFNSSVKINRQSRVTADSEIIIRDAIKN
jgi:hypothetical protein